MLAPMIDGLYKRTPRPALVRCLCLACVLAIAWLSLHPLTDWRLRQPSTFAFLAHGLPRFHTQGDLIGNVAAYLVYALLFTLGWFSPRRPWLAPLLAVLSGMLMSLCFESLQSWLPNRVPSLLDVYGNGAGAALGALIGSAIGLLRAGTLDQPGPVSAQWYQQGPAIGWILLVIWLVSQLPVQRLLFSTGHLPPALAGGLPSLQDLLALVTADAAPESLRSILETVTVAVLIATLGVLVMDLVRGGVARGACLVALLGSAYGLRVLAAMMAGPALPPLAWLTSSAQGGLLLGALAVYLVGSFRRRARALIGIGLTVLGLVLVNLSPADPYFQTSANAFRSAWSPAMTPSLRSLITLFGTIWPFAALVYFGARATTLRRTATRWRPPTAS